MYAWGVCVGVAHHGSAESFGGERSFIGGAKDRIINFSDETAALDCHGSYMALATEVVRLLL